MRDEKGRWLKGHSGNPAGMPKRLNRVIADIPRDARPQIYKTLHFALQQPNKAKAMEYLNDEILKDEPYGFVLQLAVKTLMSKDGWACAMDIMDRIFGKPRQTNDVNIIDAPQAVINFVKDDDGNEGDKSE